MQTNFLKLLWVLVAFGVLITISVYSQSKESYSRKTGDTELLARVIRAEAEAEPYTGQVAVGAVILNRIQDPDFPNTLAGVIYEPRAFESVSNGMVNRPPTESARKAANAALSGWDPSGGAIFFFNPGKVGAKSYVWTRKIIQRIGQHVFAI